MSLNYQPDDNATPGLPWNITYLSQRDLAAQIPISFLTEPGVSLQAACFATNNRYEDAAAARCLSNLLAIGFRRIILDVFWDPNRSIWSLCPVQIPLSATDMLFNIPPSQSATSAEGSTSGLFPSATPIARFQGRRHEANNEKRSTSATSQRLSTTVTINPITSANSTYVVPPTSMSLLQQEILYSIGPYTCTSTLNFGPILNVLQQYIAQSDDTLHAFVNILTINVHAAASPSAPTSSAPEPPALLLPNSSDLIGTILNNAMSPKLYTPQLLGQQRQNLNTSWLSLTGGQQPISTYFSTEPTDNNVLTTPNGWPDPIYLEVVNTRRLLAGFGSIDPQMAQYNLTADYVYIFPPDYLQNDTSTNSAGDAVVGDGCYYSAEQSDVTSTNNSWAVSSNIASLPSENNPDTSSSLVLPSVINITACGISPILNQTLSGTTADINIGPYQAFAYNAVWSWGPGEPSNNTADDNYRCATMNPSLGGRWSVNNCEHVYHGACVSSTSPYLWTITPSRSSYSDLANACPANYTFSAPRTALENTYLRHALQTASSRGDLPSNSPIWINFNSLDIEFCWVVGVGTKCPYPTVRPDQTAVIAVPTIAAVIVLVVAGLLILVKCGNNRRTSRRTRKGGDGWDYEGVPA